jgi:hypothetical protein
MDVKRTSTGIHQCTGETTITQVARVDGAQFVYESRGTWRNIRPRQLDFGIRRGIEVIWPNHPSEDATESIVCASRPSSWYGRPSPTTTTAQEPCGGVC